MHRHSMPGFTPSPRFFVFHPQSRWVNYKDQHQMERELASDSDSDFADEDDDDQPKCNMCNFFDLVTGLSLPHKTEPDEDE